MFAALLLFARTLRVILTALQAVAGILILGQGVYRWSQNQRR